LGTGRRRLNPLLRRLFSWMQHNAADATEFFRLPPNRIVELGGASNCKDPTTCHRFEIDLGNAVPRKFD
jgi:K+ transporter